MSGTTLDPQGGIFLSYRREEAGYAAGRLADRLTTRFEDTRVFIDVDSVPAGEDFVKAIRGAVARCDVLLAIIGRQWIEMLDDRGVRRLDDPEDFVVLELKEALERDIHVVPVLLDGADMPGPRTCRPRSAPCHAAMPSGSTPSPSAGTRTPCWSSSSRCCPSAPGQRRGRRVRPAGSPLRHLESESRPHPRPHPSRRVGHERVGRSPGALSSGSRPAPAPSRPPASGAGRGGHSSTARHARGGS